MRTILVVIFLSFTIWSCNPFSCCNINKVRRKLNSENANDVVSGTYCVGELKDTVSVIMLVKNMDDPRMSTLMRYYGKTVYQMKAEALFKISGIKPPVPIKQDPDSVIISFYHKWAEDAGLVK